MGLASTAETVTLHTTLIALTFGRSGDVYESDVLEKIYTENLAHLDFLFIIAELHEGLLRLSFELSGIWFCHAAGLYIA